MRSLIYYVAVSLDGFIASPEGRVDSFVMDGPHADEFVSSLAGFDGVVIGANTYRFGLQFGLKPGQPAYPGLTHYVFSQSLDFESTPEVTLDGGSPERRVAALKEKPGKAIWLCGGGKLAGTLAAAGLIDELWLKLNPIVLGAGIHLFGGHVPDDRLQLYETKRYTNDVGLMKYRFVPG